MLRRLPLSVRSLLALPLALQALVGSAIVGLIAQHNFAAATRKEMTTSLTIKTLLIHRLLSHELELLQQQAVAFAEEVSFLEDPEALRQYFRRRADLLALDGVRIAVADQPLITLGRPLPAGNEPWVWTDTVVIARALGPTGASVSTATDRDRLFQMLNSDLSERLCIEIQPLTPPTVLPLILGGDCQIGATGLSQRGHMWQYNQRFETNLGLSWRISLSAPTRQQHDWRFVVVSSAFNGVVAIALGVALSYLLTRPLNHVVANAQAISHGSAPANFEPGGIVEIDRLSQALLEITQHLQQNIIDLSESRARLNQVLDDLPIGVAIHDASGAVIYYNTAGRQILGIEAIPEGQLPELALAFQVYRAGTDELYPPAEMPVGHALQGKATIKDDLEIRLNQQRLQLRISGVPLSDETGTINGVVTVFEDVTAVKLTERLQAEYLAGLDKQFQEIQRLNTLKEDFLSTVSHELRTPIANMRMAMQMLQIALYDIELAEGLRQRVQRYFQILQQECQRETQLIEDLLALTLSSADAPTQNAQDLNPPLWLQTVAQPYYARLEAHHQRLSIQLLTDIPIIRTDPSILERAIGELLNNACKYTPQGGQIIASLRADEELLYLTLSNTGVSISDRDLPYIFDKFYRVPGHNPWAQGGTGLGLALVKQLIEHLGGSTSAKSSAQQVDFTVTLPLAPASSLAPRA